MPKIHFNEYDLEKVEPESGDSMTVSVCKWVVRHYAALIRDAQTEKDKDAINEDMGEYVFDAVQILEDLEVL